jgi:hypothetical protein
MNKTYVLPAALLVAGVLIGFLAGVSFANHYTVSLSETLTARDEFGPKIKVNVYVYRNGELVATTHNIITNAGVGLFDEALHGPAASAAPANARFIALSADSTAPAYTDTSCPSEITTGGLARAEGTVTVTAGPANGDVTVRVSKTFTASSFSNVQKACLFTAASGGILYAIATFSPVNLLPGDQLTINWDFSYNN